MNDAFNTAKGITSSEHPLTLFLLLLVLAVGIGVWRGVKAYVPKYFDALTGAVAKIPEAIASFEKALLGVESRLDKRIDDTRDEVVEKIEITKETIVREVRDERIRALAAEIRESSPESRRARESNGDPNRHRESRPDRQ